MSRALLRLALLTALAASPVHAGDPVVTDEAQRAASRGLDWLAKRQRADGSVGDESSRPVLATARAGLVFLASREHAANALKCLRFLLTQCREDGYVSEEAGILTFREGIRHPTSELVGHGEALRFLATAWKLRARFGGAEDREALEGRWKAAIGKALAFTEAHQCGNGGWGYAVRSDRDLPDEMDCGVVQVQALAACVEAGFRVDDARLKAVSSYVRSLTGKDGETGYSLSGGPEQQSARELCYAGAGLAVLSWTDGTEDAVVKRQLERLERIYGPGTGDAANPSRFGFRSMQGSLLAAVAVAQCDPAGWADWYGRARDAVAAEQRPDGSWGEAGVADSTTSYAVSILLLPRTPFLRLSPEPADQVLHRLEQWAQEGAWSLDMSGELVKAIAATEERTSYAATIRAKAGNRLAVQIDSKEGETSHRLRIADDGKSYRIEDEHDSGGGGDVENVSAFSSGMSARGGLVGIALALPFAAEEPMRAHRFPALDAVSKVSNFRRLPPDDSGPSPTIAIEYSLVIGNLEPPGRVTLWLDADTMLPVKRVLVFEGDLWKSTMTETYRGASTAEIADEVFRIK